MKRSVSLIVSLAIVVGTGLVGCARPTTETVIPNLAPDTSLLVIHDLTNVDANPSRVAPRPAATAKAQDIAVWAYVVARQLLQTEYVRIPPPWDLRFIGAGHTIKGPCKNIHGTTADDLYYCQSDDVVYVGEKMLRGFVRVGGLAGILMVLSHEFVHHVQRVAGMPIYMPWNTSRQPVELQAACGSGAAMSLALKAGVIHDSEMQAVIRTATGDSSDDDDEHGTAKANHDAFIDGFKNGLPACNHYNIIIAIAEKAA